MQKCKKPKFVSIVDDGKLFVPNLPHTNFDSMTELIGGGFTLANFIYPLYSFKLMPSVIPLAINTQGQVKFTSSKYLLLVIPLLSVVSMIRNSRLAKNPEKINYPVKLHAGNVRKVYGLGRIFSRVRCLVSQCLLFGISYSLVEASISRKSSNSHVLSSLVGLSVLAILGALKLPFSGVREG